MSAANLLRVRQRRLHVAPSLPINGNTNRLPSANTVHRRNLIRVHFHRCLRGVHNIANLALRGKRRRADTAGFRNRRLNPHGARSGNVARGQRTFQLLRDFALHANLSKHRRVRHFQTVQRVGQRRDGRLRRRILRRVLHDAFRKPRFGEFDFASQRVHDVRRRQGPRRGIRAFDRRRNGLLLLLFAFDAIKKNIKGQFLFFHSRASSLDRDIGKDLIFRSLSFVKSTGRARKRRSEEKIARIIRAHPSFDRFRVQREFVFVRQAAGE